MSDPLIRVRNAVKQYRLGRTTVVALRGVDLEVRGGEFVAIAGPSGSGKTTLLNLIGCIETPTSGTIELGGLDVGTLAGDARSQLRADKLGFIFQRFNLLPVLTALENVEFALLTKRLTARQRRALAQEALERVGLADVLRHKPLELSGGQQQRVAIARAIVTTPKLILADEPTANLDHATGSQILELMRRLNRQRGTTFVFSTHDQKVMEMANRIVKLWDGAITS